MIIGEATETDGAKHLTQPVIHSTLQRLLSAVVIIGTTLRVPLMYAHSK